MEQYLHNPSSQKYERLYNTMSDSELENPYKKPSMVEMADSLIAKNGFFAINKIYNCVNAINTHSTPLTFPPKTTLLVFSKKVNPNWKISEIEDTVRLRSTNRFNMT